MSNEVDEIKNRLDIVDLIAEYLPLKKAGKDWKARCPFHSEKTPSFMVSRDKQIFHCFGCAKGGDLFTFVQEIEGLDFAEALKLLADKTGVALTQHHAEVGQSIKNRLLEINRYAAEWFYAVLMRHPVAEAARAYVAQRGLTTAQLETFKVGFAPDRWDALTGALLKKGFGIDDCVTSGLIIKKDGARAETGRGFYDRFRGRIMFPIRNVQGQVIGFTGRILVETPESGGKYVNTPQTPLFDKSSVLYGIDTARTMAGEKDCMVIVEGQMDVISCYSVGMHNVVAASGTALTEMQVRFIKRYTNNIRVAFDADTAGVAAAKRGMDVALRSGLSVRAIRIPDGCGKDPDECIKKDAVVWFKAVDDACDIMQFYFDVVLRDLNLKLPENKKRAADELLEQIAKVPSGVLRDHWMEALATRLGVGIQALRADLDMLLKRAAPTYRSRVGGQKQPMAVMEKRSRQELLGEEIMGIFIAFGMPPAQEHGLGDELFVSDAVRSVYNELVLYYTKSTATTSGPFLGFLAQTNPHLYVGAAQWALRAETYYSDKPEEEIKREWQTLVSSLKKEFAKTKRSELTLLIKEAQRGGNREQVLKLLEQLQHIAHE